ncbi:MAG TPA: hypothetical protein IAA21_04465 [Candidatus Blautia faecigallinarum]|uniref:Uncharacterized protein n=1 Tax=Candidatus Blautia faecigallinarum TaxID=2838488 RepID=A0A9D2DS12_9FIRM|nr:hypothetical protein [Candidatus Blautia faecigallinarum]
MSKERKGLAIRFIINGLLILVVIALAYFGYAFLYRGRTEPPVRSQETSREGAIYSLRGQIQMLSSWEELSDFAFEDRKEELEYGTYVIPGLNSTRTFLTEAGTAQAVCTSMTPQGLAVTPDYVLVSAYCHTKQHNSVIYVIDKETHNFLKEVVLPGKPHVGGLAYDWEHEILWYSSNETGIAEAVSISMDSIEAYDYESVGRPVEIRQACSLYGILRDSFMTFYEGSLYVGCFMEYSESVIARYALDEEGYLSVRLDDSLGMDFEMAIPLDYSEISEQAQGMAFYHDKLLLSHSFGILPSRLVFYEQSNTRLYVNENSAVSYRFPERMEQIFVEGDDLYVLFESAAYAYRASSMNIVDRVLKLSLAKMDNGY